MGVGAWNSHCRQPGCLASIEACVVPTAGLSRLESAMQEGRLSGTRTSEQGVDNGQARPRHAPWPARRGPSHPPAPHTTGSASGRRRPCCRSWKSTRANSNLPGRGRRCPSARPGPAVGRRGLCPPEADARLGRGVSGAGADTGPDAVDRLVCGRRWPCTRRSSTAPRWRASLWSARCPGGAVLGQVELPVPPAPPDPARPTSSVVDRGGRAG